MHFLLRSLRAPFARHHILLTAATFIAALLPAAASATIYYVSSSGGSDSNINSATSIATPVKTLAAANTLLSRMHPGDSILFKRGDVWRNQTLRCIDDYAAVAGDTFPRTNQVCSGSPTGQITIGAYGTGTNPIFDGSGPFTVAWALVSGTTYSATVSGYGPLKLYVDAGDASASQLIPVPNARGAWASGTQYNAYDGVTVTDSKGNTSYFVRGPVAAGNQPTTDSTAWIGVTNTQGGNTSQTFSTTNTGLQNVEAIPGSFYFSGSTVYVNLPDGTDPSTHTFTAVTGQSPLYGVLLEGVNYVTVQGLTIERYQESGIAVIPYSSDKGTYFVGEYIHILNNNVWNYGTIVDDARIMQEHTNPLQAGILVRANGQYNPHLLRGDLIQANTIGNIDSYFGLRGQTTKAGIIAVGIDGGGTANNPVIQNNYIKTVNNSGILYNSAGLYSSGTVLLNNGGAVTGNELVNNQGNIYFSATAGGKVDHNKIHESYAEGIQLGGNSTSSATVPQTLSYNLIYHLGVSASGVLYNGIDCNGNAPNVYELNNTIVDVNSESISLENGCTGATVQNNIFDQHTLRFPTYDIINPSFLLYALIANQSSSHFSNNLWQNGTSPHPFHMAGGTTSYTCTDFFPNWPDVSSSCADPLFVNISTNDYHLQSGSPARAAGTGGSDIGACAYGSTTFPCN